MKRLLVLLVIAIEAIGCVAGETKPERYKDSYGHEWFCFEKGDEGVTLVERDTDFWSGSAWKNPKRVTHEELQFNYTRVDD